jgi:hypothetical protein
VLRRKRLPWLVLLGALAGCGSASPLGGAVGPLLFMRGPQRASITIDGLAAKVTFAGSIGSTKLTGRLSAESQGANSLCPATPSDQQSNFTYQGSYAGKPYSFSGCVNAPSSTALLQRPKPGSVQLRVRGEIGSEAIVGTATYEGVVASPAGSCVLAGSCIVTFTFPFTGSVGAQAIDGTATMQIRQTGNWTITATLTVT